MANRRAKRLFLKVMLVLVIGFAIASVLLWVLPPRRASQPGSIVPARPGSHAGALQVPA